MGQVAVGVPVLARARLFRSLGRAFGDTGLTAKFTCIERNLSVRLSHLNSRPRSAEE